MNKFIKIEYYIKKYSYYFFLKMYTKEQYFKIAMSLKFNLFGNIIHNILRTSLEYYLQKDFVKSDACINEALECTYLTKDIENLKTILGI